MATDAAIPNLHADEVESASDSGFTVPAFEQDVAQHTKVVVQPGPAPQAGQPVSIANVDPSNPDQITVTQPQLFKNPNFAHELTHVFQEENEPDVKQSPNEGNANAYGGVDPASLGKVNSVSALDVEQQARMVENLEAQREDLAQKAQAGTATQKDLDDWDTLNSASSRLMRQLAQFGKKTIDVDPAPPGPPPAALTGMAKPLPEMGGASILIRPGNGQTVSRQTAVAYYKKSGGDPAKTRAALQAHGWKIPNG